MICLPKQSNKKISEETAALTSVCEEAFIEGEKDRKHYTVLEEKKNRRCSVLLGTGSCETEFFVQEDLKSESVKLARRLSLLALSVSENIKNDSLPQVIIDYVFQISVTLDKLKSNIGSSFAGATVHYARKSSTMVDFKTTLERRKMEIGEIPCRWLKKSPQGINRFSIYGASENSSFGCQFHWVPNTQAVPSDLVSEHNSSFWLKMKEQLDKIKEGVNVDQDCLQKMNILEQISTDIESLQTETAYPSLHSSDAVFETQRRHQIPHSQEHIEHIVSLNLMMKRKLKILANNARKRHREKVRWFVHPRSRMKTLFDLFVCLLVLYSAIITPFELAFGPINRRGYNAFELFASFLFMFDIAIIFCTAFEDQGKLVYDRRRISIKYLKGTFVLDVLGSFPFGAILSSSHSSNIIRLARLSRFLRMAKMLKVGLLIFRLNRKLQSVDFSFYIESSVVSLASRVAKIVYISHLIACAWFSLDQCNRTWEAQDWSRCGADAVGSHYLAAIYFTYTTMMTVGYGDVALITGAERAFSVVVQIIGTLVMGVLVSSIGELVGSWDLHSRYLAERMSSLKVYASEKKLSRDLRIKLHKHFLYFYLHTTVFPEQTVIKSLPYSVCEKLTLEQHSDHLENLVLFKQLYSNGHKDFVLEALPLLKPMQVQGSEVVICQGDPAEELYFVLQGHINSFRTESNSVQVLTGIYSDGSTLNLEEILCHRDMYCTMQTACVSDLLWIYKEDIEMLLRSFPNVNLPLRSSAKETLKNTLRILSSETIREHIGNVTMPVKAIIRCEPIEKGKEPTLAICSASLASQLDVLNRLHMDQKSLRTIQSASARNLGGKKISTRSLNYALNIDSEVVKQDETEDSLQGKFFIDPDHKYKRIWDVMIMILTLFSVIYIPYRLAFYSHRDIQALKYTDLVIDCGAGLTETLASIPAISPAEVIEHLQKETQTRAKMHGTEERDALLGRLFGCSVLCRSGRLAQIPDSWQQLFHILIELHSTKSWLRPACVDTLLVLLWQEEDPSRIPPTCFEALGALLGGPETKLKNFRVDQLQLSLGLHRFLETKGNGLKPEGAVINLPKFVVSKKAILRPEKLPKVCEMFKEASASFPKVHSVFRWALADLVGKEALHLTDRTLENFKQFWSVVVDGVLANGSHQNKGVALLLLQLLTPSLSPEELSAALSPAVIRSLVNACKKKENHLYALANQTLERLVQSVSVSADCRLAAIISLASTGPLDFDKVTNTHTLANLMQGLDATTLSKYLEFLEAAVCQPAGQHPGNDLEDTVDNINPPEYQDSARKAWAIESMYSAVGRNSRLQCSAEWTLRTSKLLLGIGFFGTTSPPENQTAEKPKKKRKGSLLAGSGIGDGWIGIDFSSTVRQKARQRLFALASEHSIGGDKAVVKGHEFLFALHEHCAALHAQGFQLLKTLSEEAKAAQEAVVKVYHDAQNAAGINQKLSLPFLEMLLLIGLQFYEGEGGNDVADAAVDLCQCLRKLIGLESGQGESDEEEDEPMAVFADAVVTVLTDASNHCAKGVREVVKRAWNAACSLHPLSAAAFTVLVETVCGEEEGGRAEDEEADSDDEPEENLLPSSKEDGEEKKEHSNHRKRSFESEKQDSGEESSDEDADNADEVIDEDGLLDLLEEGSQGAEAENSALSAMLALRRETTKRGKVDQERARCQLRLRVLDLMEVVFQKQRENPMLISCLSPLVRSIVKLTALVKSNSKLPEATSLLQRLSSFVLQKINKYRPKLEKEKETEVCRNCLSELMETSKKGVCRVGATALTVCTRALMHAPQAQKNKKAIIDIYREGLVHFYSVRASHLQIIIFSELIDRFSSLGLALLPELMKMATSARNPYLQSEGFRMIALLIKKRSTLSDEDKATLRASCPEISNAFQKVLDNGDDGRQSLLKNRLESFLSSALTFFQSQKDLKWTPINATELSTLFKRTAGAQASGKIQKHCSQVADCVNGLPIGKETQPAKKNSSSGNNEKKGEASATISVPKKKKPKIIKNDAASKEDTQK